MEQANPERIGLLDALRGLSVLFIFVANAVYFSGLPFIPPTQQWAWATLPTDEILMMITFTAVDGKFYTIFSLLFAIGCAIQYQRAMKKGMAFRPFFHRRMSWLLVIGLIHLCLIWLGDILTLYAILGFALLWFIDVPDDRLLLWAVVFIMLPVVNWILIYPLSFDYPKTVEALGNRLALWLGNDSPAMTSMQAYLQNDRWEIFFKTNLSNAFNRWSRLFEEGRPFKVFGVFLIGLWAGRKITYANLLDNTLLLKKVAMWGLSVGIAFSALRTYCLFFADADEFWSLVETVAYALGTVPLAMGYAAAFALYYRQKTIVFLEAAGRMALTNYLMQTVIGIALFYGIGLGLAGKLGFTVVLLLAFFVFGLQSLSSILWLRKFKQGPLEKFWRARTQSTAA